MRIGRYITAILFVTGMFLLSEITGSKVIIFPEMLAILVGILCADKVPWKTDTIHTVIMMSVSSFTGVLIAALLPFPVYVQALIGFIVTGLLLMLSDCSLMPCIAACLFPIYYGETSLLYPVMVILLTGIVLILRSGFIRKGYLEESVKFRYLPDFEIDLKMWGMVIAAFALLSAVPLFTGYLAFIAPPLVVTLVECSCKPLTGRRVKIWFVITVAAVTGVLMQTVLTDMLGMPTYVSAAAAAALTLLEMRLMNMMFPPAGAVMVLSFLAEGNIFLYPPMISVGAAVVIAVSAFINNTLEEYNG